MCFYVSSQLHKLTIRSRTTLQIVYFLQNRTRHARDRALQGLLQGPHSLQLQCLDCFFQPHASVVLISSSPISTTDTPPSSCIRMKFSRIRPPQLTCRKKSDLLFKCSHSIFERSTSKFVSTYRNRIAAATNPDVECCTILL